MRKKVYALVVICVLLAAVSVYFLVKSGSKKIVPNYDSCHNGIKDGDEAGTDCGGVCEGLFQAACVKYESIAYSPPLPSVDVCGDGFCKGSESVESCLTDCKGSCGDGFCNPRTESPFSGTPGYCSSDCREEYLLTPRIWVVEQQNPSCDDNSADSGTKDKPLCTLNAASFKARGGDSIFIRGIQAYNHTVRFLNDSQNTARITVRGYPGERGVIEMGERVGGGSDSWTFEKSFPSQDGNEGYKVWSIESGLGPFVAQNLSENTSSNYPAGLVREGQQLLSRRLNLNEFETQLTSYWDKENFEAYYMDCSNGRLYVRLLESVDPNNERFYWLRGQIQISYPNVRFVDLNLRHGLEGVFLSFPAGFEIYDSLIEETSMGIGDYGSNTTVAENNTIRRIGSKQLIVPSSNAGLTGHLVAYCPSKQSWIGGYNYNRNYLEHAIYGTTIRGTQFTNNFVEMPDIEVAVAIQRNSNYSGNIIKGGVLITSGSSEFFNNIVESYRLEALEIRGGLNKIYNNIFSGSPLWTQYPIIPIINLIPGSEFRNNIIVNTALPEFETGPCIRASGGSSFNNNIYINCFNWSVKNGEVYTDYSNFGLWKNAWTNIGNDNESFISTSGEVFADFAAGNLTHKINGAAIDRGIKIRNLSFDINKNLRPYDILGVGEDGVDERIYDIGPYEFPIVFNEEISDCGTISLEGNYKLINNLFSTGICLIINADNVAIDGNGLSINGSGAINTRGIIAQGRKNLTIKNLRVYNYSSGIYLYGTNDSKIINNSLEENLAGILLVESSNRNYIKNNKLSRNKDGIYLSFSSDNKVEENLAYSNYFTGIVSDSGGGRNNFTDNNVSYNTRGFDIYLSNSNNFINNKANFNSQYGIRLQENSNGNTLVNNILVGNLNNGIYLNSSGNLIWGGLIKDSVGSALLLLDFAKNNLFRSVEIQNTSRSYFDLKIESSGADGNVFEDIRIMNYTFGSSGSLISVRDTRYGEIKFLQRVNGSGTNFSRDIYISDNFAEVRSDLNAGLNKSANVTLYGIGNRANNLVILRNGVLCGNICYNFTALNETNVVFNVSYWTSYSISSFAPATCSDGIQNQGESGVDCGGPCAACGGGGGGGGAGGSGRGRGLPLNQICEPNWRCTNWGACDENNLKRRTCFDLNACNLSTGKPYEVEACPIPEDNSTIDLRNESAGGGAFNPIFAMLRDKTSTLGVMLAFYFLVLILLIALSLRRKSAPGETAKKVWGYAGETREEYFKNSDSNLSIGSQFGGHLR